jgi:hypothetical protein
MIKKVVAAAAATGRPALLGAGAVVAGSATRGAGAGSGGVSGDAVPVSAC